jgi:threonine/homoserine/homoserine lactone efflux protein
MAGTLVGMAPLCFVQAYFSQEIFTAFPRLIYPVILAGVGYLIFMAHILRQLAKSQRTSAEF